MKPTGPRELPIIFTAESVRAILANRKSQTRRLAKFVPFDGVNLSFSGLSVGHYCAGAPELGWCLYSTGEGGMWNQRSERLFSRFLPGDRIWAKETWMTEELNLSVFEDGVRFRADGFFLRIPDTQTASDAWCKANRGGIGWRSPLYMPRWASRLTLEVAEVRAQRVQAISEEDAIAEGFGGSEVETPREQFASAWDVINGRRSPWSRNDFVFAYTFRRIKP